MNKSSFLVRNFCLILSIAILVCFYSVPIYASGNPNWEKNMGTRIGTLNDITFGNDVFIAVGQDGLMVSSKDGDSWTHINPGTTDHLQKVLWNGSSFVAIGTRTTLTSKDGIDWSVKISDGEYTFKNLVWTGKFLILTATKNEFFADESTQILISENGSDWTLKSVLNNYCIKDIMWKDDKAIAVGAKGINGFITTSTDLVNWKKTDFNTRNMFFHVVSNDKDFFVYGSNNTILKSTDGYNWNMISSSTKSAPLNRDFIWDGNKFIAVGDGPIIKVSQDGVSWTNLLTLEINSQLLSLTYSNNRYVAVGDNGGIVKSDDSVNWSVVSKAENFYLNDVKWNGDTFVAVGVRGMILTSPDGLTWTRRESKTKNDIYSVIWDTSKFIATCQSGVVLVSYDAVNWTSTNTNIYFRTGGVAWNGSTYVAIGDTIIKDKITNTSIYTSTDGLSWKTNQPLISSSPLSSISWDGNQFICLGQNEILTSLDGIKWEKPYTHSLGMFTAIAYNGQRYVAICNTGDIYTSKNMGDWEKSSFNQKLPLSNIIYINSQFFIVGGRGTIISSSDGVSWIAYPPKTNSQISNIAFKNNIYVAVGGQIMTATQSDTINVYINSKLLSLDTPPISKDGRILVPLRAIFESMGAEVKWDDSTKTITGLKGSTQIVLTLDSTDATVNGETKVLDVPAMSIDGRTFVPVRFISESLGAQVDWDNQSRSVIITYK